MAEITLGLGQWAVSNDPQDMLVCLGLGSCVAFVAYDAVSRVAGMAHMVLPDSTQGRLSASSPAKFVNVAIPLVLEGMRLRGVGPHARLVVDLVGGARVLRGVTPTGAMNIGERNAAAAIAEVAAQGLAVRSQELGGTSGRTIRLAVATGDLSVSTTAERRVAA